MPNFKGELKCDCGAVAEIFEKTGKLTGKYYSKCKGCKKLVQNMDEETQNSLKDYKPVGFFSTSEPKKEQSKVVKPVVKKEKIIPQENLVKEEKIQEKKIFNISKPYFFATVGLFVILLIIKIFTKKPTQNGQSNPVGQQAKSRYDS